MLQLPAISIYIVPLIVILAFLASAIRILREYERGVVFTLGRFGGVKGPGLIILIPFVQQMVRVDLRTRVLDVPPQDVITRDNVSVKVNAVIYYRVMDPEKAILQVEDYNQATSELAQTTLRSEIGKMELDKTFESRDEINRQVVAVLDEAGRTWGVKVLRYEIKNLTPPEAILRSMQAQITAEREKRALIAKSEGQRQEEINLAEGVKQAAVLESEGQKIAQVNKAEGEAKAITTIADATAGAVRIVASALNEPGGMNAANLKVAEHYITAFANLAKSNNTMIVPGNVADVATMVGTAMNTLNTIKAGPGATTPK